MSETLEIIPKYRLRNVKGQIFKDFNVIDAPTFDGTQDNGQIIEFVKQGEQIRKKIIYVEKIAFPLELGISIPMTNQSVSGFYQINDIDDLLKVRRLIEIANPSLLLEECPLYENDGIVSTNDSAFNFSKPSSYISYFDFGYRIYAFSVLAPEPITSKFVVDKEHIFCEAIQPSKQGKFRSYAVNQGIDYGTLIRPPQTYYLPVPPDFQLDYLEVIN